MKISVIIALLFAASVLVADDEPKAIGLKAAKFTLEDQYEQKWAWKDHWQGKPTVLVISDWKGSDYTENWTIPLAERFRDRVQFVAIADLSLSQEAPSFMQGTLEWRGRVCDYYRVRDGLPNVIYIDALGIVQLHTWGTGKDDHVTAFAEALEKRL